MRESAPLLVREYLSDEMVDTPELRERVRAAIQEMGGDAPAALVRGEREALGRVRYPTIEAIREGCSDPSVLLPLFLGWLRGADSVPWENRNGPAGAGWSRGVHLRMDRTEPVPPLDRGRR